MSERENVPIHITQYSDLNPMCFDSLALISTIKPFLPGTILLILFPLPAASSPKTELAASLTLITRTKDTTSHSSEVSVINIWRS